MLELLKPALFVIFSWAGLFFIFSGVGLVALRGARGLGIGSRLPRLFHAFWIGWALTLALLQVWHLFFAVNWLALCLVWLLGMAGLYLYRRELWEWIRREARERARFWLVAGLAALWFAHLATGPSAIYDTGLYHVPSVRWAELYPIVPGLGNLHGRLALNSSYFLYAALLDAGEWAGRAHHLAGGLLMTVMLVYSIRSLAALFSAEGNERIRRLFYALLLVPVIIEAAGGNISTFSNDLPAFALGLVVSGELLELLLGRPDRQDERFSLLFLCAMVCAGIAVKLSFATYGITALGVAFAAWLAGRPARTDALKTLGGVGMLFLIVLLPWMARGLILSGYPFYPSVFGGIDVPWQVPRSLAINEANWIHSWPRNSTLFWADVLGNWNWLNGWVGRLSQDVLRALGIAIVAGLCAAFAPRPVRQQRRAIRLPLWLVLLPAVVSLVFWFTSSPNPSSAMFAFWLLAAGSVALALAEFLPVDVQREKARPLLFAVVAAFSVFLSPMRAPLIVAPGADAGFHPIETTAYETRATNSGLVVYLPKADDRCGAAPLPCTPYYRASLDSIIAFGSRPGFSLDDSLVYMDMHGLAAKPDPSLPPGLSVLYRNGWLAPDSPHTTLRWTSTPSDMLLYSDTRQTIRLLLTPFKMHVAGNFGDVGQLRVLLNNKIVGTWTVRRDVTTEITLRLSRDFNKVRFEYLGGNFVPKDSVPGSADERVLAIGFNPPVIVPLE